MIPHCSNRVKVHLAPIRHRLAIRPFIIGLVIIILEDPGGAFVSKALSVFSSLTQNFMTGPAHSQEPLARSQVGRMTTHTAALPFRQRIYPGRKIQPDIGLFHRKRKARSWEEEGARPAYNPDRYRNTAVSHFRRSPSGWCARAGGALAGANAGRTTVDSKVDHKAVCCHRVATMRMPGRRQLPGGSRMTTRRQRFWWPWFAAKVSPAF